MTNSEIKSCYQTEPKFKGVYSRNELPNIMKNVTYLVNLNQWELTGQLCMLMAMMRHTLKALELKTLQNKSKNLLALKI